MVYIARAIAKSLDRAYTAPLTCAPLFKVSQVEIEVGDCEGRLPLLFLLSQLSVVSGQSVRMWRRWSPAFDLSERILDSYPTTSSILKGLRKKNKTDNGLLTTDQEK